MGGSRPPYPLAPGTPRCVYGAKLGGWSSGTLLADRDPGAESVSAEKEKNIRKKVIKYKVEKKYHIL